MIELLILLLGCYIGIMWTLVMLKDKLSKRCWGCIAFHDEVKEKNRSLRCIKQEKHEGKCYWTNFLRTEYKEW